jgi:hypothetical protein
VLMLTTPGFTLLARSTKIFGAKEEEGLAARLTCFVPKRFPAFADGRTSRLDAINIPPSRAMTAMKTTMPVPNLLGAGPSRSFPIAIRPPVFHPMRCDFFLRFAQPFSSQGVFQINPSSMIAKKFKIEIAK